MVHVLPIYRKNTLIQTAFIVQESNYPFILYTLGTIFSFLNASHTSALYGNLVVVSYSLQLCVRPSIKT